MAARRDPGFEDSNRFRQPTRDDLGVFSLEVTKGLGSVELTSLSGYLDRRLELDRDFSLFIAELAPPLLPNVSYNVSVTKTADLSQELRLATVDPHARLRWTLGAFYSHQHDDFNQLIHTAGAGSFYGTGTDIIYAGGFRPGGPNRFDINSPLCAPDLQRLGLEPPAAVRRAF